jgi:hypothetical protein
MERIIREETDIELHPENMNRVASSFHSNQKERKKVLSKDK